jgi:choline dehydrogenase
VPLTMAPHFTSLIDNISKIYLLCVVWSATAFASPISLLLSQDALGSSFGTSSNSVHDYLIVGGGTAGLVLANRLSHSGLHTVAVIEAGSFYEIDSGNVSQIPRYVWNGAGLGFSDVNPLIDWEFKTEPEEGIDNATIHYTRGKTLGGSSARNHMIYQRPTRGTLENWAKQVGDDAYEWDSFKKYYDKSVTFHPADATKRLDNSTPPLDLAGGRATSGPVSISYTNYVLPFTSWAIKAAQGLGITQLAGYLDGDLIGSGWDMQTKNSETMIRESSETAYLRPILKRPNLSMYHSTMALKVLLEGKKAVGIACSTKTENFTLTARKEVILSAGAFQSPQLLMVSGIGPKEILDKFEIPVLLDTPGVGKGLQV